MEYRAADNLPDLPAKRMFFNKENEFIKERVLYYEPFVGFVPTEHRLFKNKELEVENLNLDDILLLEDGHCFKESVINLCSTFGRKNQHFQLHSGSFDTLIKLSKEGLRTETRPKSTVRNQCAIKRRNRPE